MTRRYSFINKAIFSLLQQGNGLFLWPQKGILIYGGPAFGQVFLYFLYGEHNVPRMV